MVPAGAGPGNRTPTTTGRPMGPGREPRAAIVLRHLPTTTRRGVGMWAPVGNGGAPQFTNHAQPPGAYPRPTCQTPIVSPHSDAGRHPRWGAGPCRLPRLRSGTQSVTDRLNVTTYPRAPPRAPTRDAPTRFQPGLGREYTHLHPGHPTMGTGFPRYDEVCGETMRGWPGYFHSYDTSVNRNDSRSAAMGTSLCEQALVFSHQSVDLVEAIQFPR